VVLGIRDVCDEWMRFCRKSIGVLIGRRGSTEHAFRAKQGGAFKVTICSRFRPWGCLFST
jgi:hypothetical protein